MSLFFITGLPRSRTCWLAAYLSHGNAKCFHDLSGEVKTPVELIDRMLRSGAEHTGDSDSGLAMYYEAISQAYPAAKWVVVRRNASASIKWLKELGVTNPAPIIQILEDRIGDLILKLNPMVVEFEDLSREKVEEIAAYCIPGWVEDKDRSEFFSKLSIKLLPKDEIECVHGQFRGIDTKFVTKPLETEAFLAYRKVIKAVCCDDQEAVDFANTIIRVSHTWDHIVDGDPVSNEAVNSAFESLLLELPTNPFVRAHAVDITSSLRQCVDLWKTGSREGAFRIYTELPMLIARIKGMNMDQVQSEVEGLVGQLRMEDDIRDGD